MVLYESIINMLKQFINIQINSEYEIKFGKQLLCIKFFKDPNKIYIYNYFNNSFTLSGIIDLFSDKCEYIFNKYFKEKLFFHI